MLDPQCHPKSNLGSASFSIEWVGFRTPAMWKALMQEHKLAVSQYEILAE